MKGKMLQAEVIVNMERIGTKESIEINLLLLEPKKTREYHQIQKPANAHLGYPSSTPEGKGHTGVNGENGRYNDLHNRANVKVRSVIVNVNTRNVSY